MEHILAVTKRWGCLIAYVDLNGSLDVVSTPGEGTAIRVYFPLVAEAGVLEEVTVDNPAAPQFRGTKRIMIVDDEELIFKINKRRLEGLGYKVDCFVKSRDALESFRSFPEKYDLLVTDQTMPEISGLDLTKAFLEMKPELPVIMCTAHSGIATAEKALSHGIEVYLNKPLESDELVYAVEKVLFGKGWGD